MSRPTTSRQRSLAWTVAVVVLEAACAQTALPAPSSPPGATSAPSSSDSAPAPAASSAPPASSVIEPAQIASAARPVVPASVTAPQLRPPPWPFQEPVPGIEAKPGSRATRYGRLSSPQCRAELRKRGLPVRAVRSPTRGIATPLRLTGLLHDVSFVAPGETSVHGILDCRLVLALDDFAEILARHQVAAVRVDNYYRERAHLPGRRKLSQHAHGLAIDLTAIVLRDGRSLDVEQDWRGAIGEAPCGPDAHPHDPTEKTLLLRDIVCEVARSGVFHFMLTPDFNAAHRNHLHFDLQRKPPGMAVR